MPKFNKTLNNTESYREAHRESSRHRDFGFNHDDSSPLSAPVVSIDSSKMTKLKDMIGNTLYDTVLDFFVEDAREVESDLIDAIDEKNMHKITVTCEHFKSLCTLVGAEALYDATAEIEAKAAETFGKIPPSLLDIWQSLLMHVINMIKPTTFRDVSQTPLEL